jgi:hypothetical protein
MDAIVVVAGITAVLVVGRQDVSGIGEMPCSWFVLVLGHAPLSGELPRFENSRNVEMKR